MATLPNLQPFYQAGIDPKTGLPLKLTQAINPICLEDIVAALRVADEQLACNRYTWYNLPAGITADLIERILYYRGRGVLFYLNDKFFFLPFTLGSKGIDYYGRFNNITPLPFNGGTTDKKEQPIIKGLEYDVFYEVALPEEFIGKSAEEINHILSHSAVILNDYIQQQSQNILPRQRLNDPIIKAEAECLPLMRTALFNATGLVGMRVETEDDQKQAALANQAINHAALNGQRYIPIVGHQEFQELAGGSVNHAQDFLLAMEGIDNFRVGLYGVETGGIFEKKAHMLESEQEMRAGSSTIAIQDGLRNRQDFATICNSLFLGLPGFTRPIWCEINETIAGIDRNGDMEIGGDEGKYDAPAAETETQEETAND